MATDRREREKLPWRGGWEDTGEGNDKKKWKERITERREEMVEGKEHERKKCRVWRERREGGKGVKERKMGCREKGGIWKGRKK